MRRGEILNIKKSHIDFTRQTLPNPFFPDALPMSQSGQNEKQKTCLRYSQQQQITVTIM